jgi:hypothetical protein
MFLKNYGFIKYFEVFASNNNVINKILYAKTTILKKEDCTSFFPKLRNLKQMAQSFHKLNYAKKKLASTAQFLLVLQFTQPHFYFLSYKKEATEGPYI